MHSFIISFLLFFAGWMHSGTGDTYVVACEPPHTTCEVVDITRDGKSPADWQPVLSAAVQPTDLVGPWGQPDPTAEYWFIPINEQ